MKAKTVLVVSGFVLVLMIITFIFDKSTISPYLEVSEITENMDAYNGTFVRVMARVKNDTVFESLDDKITKFSVTDSVLDISVIYNKIGLDVPENEIVVVSGKMIDGVLYGTKLDTKCPSKEKGKLFTSEE